ncbi:hypothetical protein ACFLQI_00315 [Candidatus Undinarchaeota archaeon]
MEKYKVKKKNKLVELVPDSLAVYIIFAVVVILSLTTIFSFALTFLQPLVTKVSVLVFLLAFAAILRYPERYKPPFSFNVAMSFTILVTISNGVIAGLLFGIVLALIECRVTLNYNSLPITIYERILCAVLTAIFYAGGGIVLYPVLFIAIAHLTSIPLRLASGNAPLPLMLIYITFNTLWQAWFLSVFGVMLIVLL